MECGFRPRGEIDGETDEDIDRETDRELRPAAVFLKDIGRSGENASGFLPRTGDLEPSLGDKSGGEMLLFIICLFFFIFAACRSGDKTESPFPCFNFLPRPDEGLSGLLIRDGGEMLLCIRFWTFDSSASSAIATFTSSLPSTAQVSAESSDCQSSEIELPSVFFPFNFLPFCSSSTDSEDSQDAGDDSGAGDRVRACFLRKIEGDAKEGIFGETAIECLSRLGGDTNALKDDGGGRT